MRSLVVCMLLIFLLGSVVCAEPVAKDTLLFANVGGKLCQMVFVNGMPGAVAQWSVELNGKRLSIDSNSFIAFRDGWLVPVPAVNKESKLAVIAQDGTKIEHIVKLQKRWTVYLTPHTHFDLGFTDVQTQIWDDLTKNLRDVLDMCDQTDSYPAESRYRWTIECSSILEEFAIRYPADMPRLIKRVKEGRIEVAGLYFNLLTELCGGEEFCRSFYPLERFNQQYGIKAETAMHDDIPGITWQAAQLLSKSGIKYLSLRANPVRAKLVWDRPEAVVRPFIWEAPDGSDVMMWYTDSYRDANFFRDTYTVTAYDNFCKSGGGPYSNFLDIIARQERKGTPVDSIQMRMGGDNLEPVVEPCKWAKQWNEHWAYPKLVVGTNKMFFASIEKYRPQLAKYKVDITDWWADGAASTARETGMARINHERTAMAETLDALVDGGRAGDTWGLYKEILRWDEHTWGAKIPIRENDPANAAKQWEIKADYAITADKQSRELMGNALNGLADAVRSDAKRLVVWNPSSWARSGMVQVKLPEGYAVYEPGKDKPLVIQKSGESYAVWVDGVSGLGWKAFDIKPGSYVSDGKTDVKQPLQLGYIYEFGAKRDKYNPVTDHPRYNKTFTRAETSVELLESGPLFSKQVIKFNNPKGAKSAYAEITSYNNSRQVDVTAFVDKTRIEQVEGVYLEFPFELNDPAVQVQLPFAWMNPATDRLPCTCTDFFSIDHAIDLNDGKQGVTLASVEAPMMEFGRITTDEWADNFKAGSGKVYSYLMANAWFTNYQYSQEGPTTFHYGIRYYDGGFDPLAAYKFGEETSRPLQAQLVEEGKAGKWAGKDLWSSLKIEPGNVVVAAAKRAEDGKGVIIRLAEAAGKAADVRISGLGVKKAYLCDLLENNTRQVAVDKRVIRFKVKPNEVVTLRAL